MTFIRYLHVLVYAGVVGMAEANTWIEQNCVEDTGFTLLPVAQYVDEGFRPLTEEEIAEINPSQTDESQTGWRPQSTKSDCENKSSSLLEPEERGYRPLDYGTIDQTPKGPAISGQTQQGYPGSPPRWNQTPGYMPGYLPSYGAGYGPGYGYEYNNPYMSPMYSPMPLGNSWFQGSQWFPGGGYGGYYGGQPYNSMPQFLPGYGVMPYMFGGGVPY